MAHSFYTKFVLVFVCFIIVTTHGKKGGKGQGDMGMKMIKCKGQDANMDAIKPQITTCKESAVPDGPEVDMKTKFLMMKVCVFEGIGVVKDNQFDKAKFDETIKAMYPGKVGDDLMEATAGCITPENIGSLSKENYSSYQPLIDCLWKSLGNHCKVDEKKKKKVTG